MHGTIVLFIQQHDFQNALFVSTMTPSASSWKLMTFSCLTLLTAYSFEIRDAHNHLKLFKFDARLRREMVSPLSLARDPNLSDAETDNNYSERSRTRSESSAVSGGGFSTLFPTKITAPILASVFIFGIAFGITLDTGVNTNPRDLSSRDAIDKAAPDSGLCLKYGSSAMVMDERVFVSFNPFNIYVTQADVKPGCVLLPANVVPVLQGRGLLDNAEIAACKQNMNTWAFVGDLDGRPQLSCVYKSKDAQNEFLESPTAGVGEDIYDNGIPREYSTEKRVKQ